MLRWQKFTISNDFLLELPKLLPQKKFVKDVFSKNVSVTNEQREVNAKFIEEI